MNQMAIQRKLEFIGTWVDDNLKAYGRVVRHHGSYLFRPRVNIVQIRKLQEELTLIKIFMWCLKNWSHVLEDLPCASKAIEAVDCLAAISNKFKRRRCYFESFLEQLYQELMYHLKPVLKETFLDLSDHSLECKCSSKLDFKELLDFALKNLKDLLVPKLDVIVPQRKLIGAVQKRLECVSAIFHFASRDQHVDQLNSFFNHVKDWANSAAGLPFLYLDDEIDERVNAAISDLMEKFKPCTLELAQLYLGALKALKPSDEDDFTLKQLAVAGFLEILLEDLPLPADDGFELLQHGLTFFMSLHVNPPPEYDEEWKLSPTQRNLCVNEAASLICTLYSSNLKEDIAKRSSTLHDLADKMEQAKAEIRELHLEITASSWDSFPRTNVKGFLDSFFEDLNEKLKYEPLTTYQKHQVMTIQKLLLSLNPSHIGLFENDELKHLRTRISRMAYRADYIIDCCFLSDPTNYWHSVMGLSDIIEEIQLITTELNKFGHAQMCNDRVHGDEMNPCRILPPQDNKRTRDDVMVGFRDEKEKIIHCLTEGLPQREIVAIVGMAGQGKATLAWKVYHEPRVRLHFQKYAWRCISQEYKIKDILIDILRQVDPKYDITCRSLEDLAEGLYRCLKGKPYLIVMDDIWNIKAWKELKASFPDDKNGSRIMFTSRIHTVALEAKHDCSLHELHPLSPEDSLELLQLKLSYEDDFPPNLLDTGKQIAETCKGLPLAIVVIAGLLAKADGNLAVWKQIAESVNSQVTKEGCMDILEVSFTHLPDYLKPCFLYLAAFPENETILAKRLTRYWIAEGFIKKPKTKTLENVANEYLIDLVDRSLLFVAKRSSRCGIKKCVVHDLVREFCMEKTKEENFLLVPNMSDDHSFDTMHQQYRLCFHTEEWPSFELKPTIPAIRTLLFFEPMEDPRAPFISILFKVLRVLDLDCGKICFGIDAIMQLAHLRYLALQGAFDVPPSIVNLSRLEFLLLYVPGYSLPKTIWNLRSLRHLYLSGRPFEGMDDLVDESFQLDNLVTFSSNYTCSEAEFNWQLRRIPNVQKLSISFRFYVSLSGFLRKLESLKLSVTSQLRDAEFDLPLSLRKLIIDVPIMSAGMISAIGRLQNLEVLKLLQAYFKDPRWDVEDEEFLNLKYLKLRSSNIKQWNASTDAFPVLQQLILKRCYYLTEIPSRFGALPTLKEMKISKCPKLANSVDEIVAEQRDLGDGFQITTDFSDEE